MDEDVKLVCDLRQSAQRDELTSLLNKAAMLKKATQLFKHSLENGQAQGLRTGTNRDGKAFKSHAMVSWISMSSSGRMIHLATALVMKLSKRLLNV